MIHDQHRARTGCNYARSANRLGWPKAYGLGRRSGTRRLVGLALGQRPGQTLYVDRRAGEQVLQTHFGLPAIAGSACAVTSGELRDGALDGRPEFEPVFESLGLLLGAA